MFAFAHQLVVDEALRRPAPGVIPILYILSTIPGSWVLGFRV